MVSSWVVHCDLGFDVAPNPARTDPSGSMRGDGTLSELLQNVQEIRRSSDFLNFF